MKFYLSSYKLGNEAQRIRELMPKSNKKLGYIPNALDFSGADSGKKIIGIEKGMEELRELGVDVELLDLKNYFGKKDELGKKLYKLGGVFVVGGNTFVLRQAMRLSGFDDIFAEMRNRDFLYSGFSAGICVLASDMRPLEIIDNSKDTPYNGLEEAIFDGLGVFDHVFLPHYKSDHPESPGADKAVEYCERNNIPFKPLRDGEVIIIE